jgi:hypothetical protein
MQGNSRWVASINRRITDISSGAVMGAYKRDNYKSIAEAIQSIELHPNWIKSYFDSSIILKTKNGSKSIKMTIDSKIYVDIRLKDKTFKSHIIVCRNAFDTIEKGMEIYKESSNPESVV